MRFSRRCGGTDADDATLPEHGWPWPWEDSTLTDFAYTYDGGETLVSRMGRKWRRDGEEDDGPRAVEAFPDMTAQRKLATGSRSGLMLLGLPREHT